MKELSAVTNTYIDLGDSSSSRRRRRNNSAEAGPDKYI